MNHPECDQRECYTAVEGTVGDCEVETKMGHSAK